MAVKSSNRQILLKYFLILTFTLFFTVLDARVFSSKKLEELESNQPFLYNLSPENSYYTSQRFRRFSSSRYARSITFATPLSPSNHDCSEPNRLCSYLFNLGNYRSHNQAVIHWPGPDDQVIFVLTRTKLSNGDVTESTLWRSVDHGKTYSEQIEKFHADNLKLKTYEGNPNNQSKLIFIEAHDGFNRVWITRDKGETYQYYNINFALEKIKFHPQQEDWLLGYDKESSYLYVSQNLGQAWIRLYHGVTNNRFMWFVEGVDNGPRSSEIVHFEYCRSDLLSQKACLVKSCYIPNCDPTPFQNHCDDLGLIKMQSLVVQDNYTIVQKPGDREKLYVSHMRGPFIKAQFPGYYEQIDFHVVSAANSTIVLGISNHRGAANLFTSDVKGRSYALSLENIRYFYKETEGDTVFNVDIHQVASVTGTYVANKLTTRGSNVTRITWDYGKSWSYLAMPSNDDTRCRRCHLNLHCSMTTTKNGYYMPNMLSKQSVPGMLVAQGAVSKTLVDYPHSVNVYVSEDAGLTWKKALSYRHLVNIGDNGAMIVGVKLRHREQMQVLSFSSDAGRTWSTHQFSKVPLSIDGLLTAPEEYSHWFTILGHTDKNYQGPWTLVALNLRNLTFRNCSYPQDFRNWTMAVPPSQSKCHMGLIQTFEEVNTKNCFVHPQYKRFTSKIPCNCTEMDYKCGYDYVLQADKNCTSTRQDIVNTDEIYDHEGYTDMSRGTDETLCVDGMKSFPTEFQRIHGDQCLNDLPGKLYKNVPCLEELPISVKTDCDFENQTNQLCKYISTGRISSWYRSTKYDSQPSAYMNYAKAVVYHHYNPAIMISPSFIPRSGSHCLQFDYYLVHSHRRFVELLVKVGGNRYTLPNHQTNMWIKATVNLDVTNEEVRVKFVLRLGKAYLDNIKVLTAACGNSSSSQVEVVEGEENST